jgi:hypothetical protein
MDGYPMTIDSDDENQGVKAEYEESQLNPEFVFDAVEGDSLWDLQEDISVLQKDSRLVSTCIWKFTRLNKSPCLIRNHYLSKIS